MDWKRDQISFYCMMSQDFTTESLFKAILARKPFYLSIFKQISEFINACVLYFNTYYYTQK